MEFAKTIIYVDDVEETLDFYFQAFGLSTIKDDGSGQYAELDTGQVKLAFSSHPFAQSHFKQSYIRAQPKQPVLGFEIRLSCENVIAAYDKAVAAGAEPFCPPADKSNGQTLAYVRSIEGTLVALCSKL